MKTIKLKSNKGNNLEGPILLIPKIFNDSRGFFYESWNQLCLDEILGKKIIFKQDNHSSSDIGVLRGLHYQIPPMPQNKLIRCISGEVFDVLIDIRKSSYTFGEWASVTLNDSNKFMLWVPIGFAHGFLSLKHKSEVFYKTTEFYNKDNERTIRWDDKISNINWPLKSINLMKPTLSEKDANGSFLNQADLFN